MDKSVRLTFMVQPVDVNNSLHLQLKDRLKSRYHAMQ